MFILAYCWVLAVILSRLLTWLAVPPSAQTPTTTLQARMTRGTAIELAGGAVLVAALVDIAECALQAFVAIGCVRRSPVPGCTSGVLSWSLYVVTSLKWVIFAGIAITIVLGFLALASLQRMRVRELARVLVASGLRSVLVMVLGFAYLMGASPFADQAADLLRRWRDEEWQAIVAVVLTLVLACVIQTCARTS